MYNPFTLKGKTILVTGASSGIGRATAVECSRMGALVIAHGRDAARLDETMSMLEGAGHVSICADLTDEEQVRHLTGGLRPVDGLVHCAGMSALKPIQFLKDSELHGIFATNTFSAMMLQKHLLKKKKLNSGASVVLVSSISGNANTAVGLSAYGASKAALDAFARYAALELAQYKIRVNTILPGRVTTQLLSTVALDDKTLQADIEKYPMRRYGTPEEIAQSAVYLLSDAARWITGTGIIIDGGRSLI